jgi:hypothetical protein
MPSPSSTSAQDINTEIGYGSTASVNLNETRVRNLACKSSGQISFADCRWGINIPGGSGYFSYGKEYDSTNLLSLSDSQSTSYPAGVTSSVQILIRSNGQFTLYTAAGGYILNKTWLTSGSAGDALSGGDSTNTDHALSTTRAFNLDATISYPGPGTDSKTTEGNLILKDSGGTLITRPVYFSVSAEVFSGAPL